ncbi:MAG TPA: hypothetical protein VFN55_14965 [Solirubrobacteraceae bacterium]|nr:hypothetical protein [Solirubrobacteraceae bacterium]
MFGSTSSFLVAYQSDASSWKVGSTSIVGAGEQAVWLSRRRRRWCRRGALPAICLVRARGVERVDQNVLVVSIDGLLPAL